MDNQLQLFISIALGYWWFTWVLQYFRLSHIPGPYFARCTDFWRVRKQRSGRPTREWLSALHEKYGPLVRIAPNTISVSDASCMKTIFTSKGDFRKADSYATMRFNINGRSVGSLIDMIDEEEFKRTKRAVGAAFITKNLLDYEPDVDIILAALHKRLVEHPTCRLYQLISLFQQDFLMKAIFSEQGGSLQAGHDVHGLGKSDRGPHWVHWQPIPWLERWIYHGPIWGRFMKRDLAWLNVGNSFVKKRQADKSGEKKTDLLQRFLDASEKQPDVIPPNTVTSLVWSVMSAGRDTTVAASTAMITFLLQNPEQYRRVMDELTNAGLSSPPKYSEVRGLPYLDAVMKETLRLNPSPPIVMERVVPPEGTVLRGVEIPGETVVGVLASIVHQDKECFGEDAAEFRPERWFTENVDARLRMERAFIGWGGGSRVCLGRHIAELEVKKLVPALLMGFDIKIADGSVIPGSGRIMPFNLTVTATPRQPGKR